MADLLCVLSDTPLKDGSTKYFRKLTELLDLYLRGYTYSYVHVYPEYSRSVTVKDIFSNAQPIYDQIQSTHPKAILAFGDKAFRLLGLPNTKISEIGNIPQRFTKDIWKVGKSTIDLPTHKDILILPTYKFESLMSYKAGYKGMPLLIRQISRLKEYIDQFSFWRAHDDAFYDSILRLHTTDVEKAIASLDRWRDTEILSLDIETAGYGVPVEAQLDYRHNKAKITLIGIGDTNTVDVYCTARMPELIPHFKKFLEERPKRKLQTWNGSFDLSFIHNLWDVDLSNITQIEGMTCLYLSDMGMSFLGKGATTLKFSSSTFCKDGLKLAGYHKDAGIDIAIKEGDSDKLLKEEKKYMVYNGIDVWACARTIGAIWNTLPLQSRKLVTQYYPVLESMFNEIHKKGLRIDVPKLANYISDLAVFIASLEEILQREAKKLGSDRDLNFRSNPDVGYIIYDLLKLPITYTEAGNRQVSTEILESFQDESPICKLICDYRSFVKQHDMFITMENHLKNGRVFPFYDFRRTTSGRLSCTKPPIQTIPETKVVFTKDPGNMLRPRWKTHTLLKNGYLEEKTPFFKELILPDPGYEFIYSDYSQLEVVILACYIDWIKSPDTTLQDTIRRGVCVHSYNTSLVYSRLMNTEYTCEFIQAHKKEDPYESWRRAVKAVTFGIIYGATPVTISRTIGMSLEDTEKVYNTVLDVLSGIRHFMNHQKTEAWKKHSIDTIAGHRRNLPITYLDRFNKRAYNIALNHPIQGTASYIVNLAMIELNKRIKDIGGDILLTVHDSILSQVPKDMVQEGLKLYRSILLEFPKERLGDFLTVPLKIDLKVGSDWHNLVEVA